MTLLHKAVESKKFDSRIVEKNITRGILTSEEYDKFLKSLPDDSDNADWVNIEELAKTEDTGN
jgi:hypothetical protein